MGQTRFLDGGGDMARAIREFDWAQTPLGPIASWSSALKTAVGMMVNSHFPKCIVWGPGRTTIYNDAFRPILGRKPEALGRPFGEVWQEVWDEIAPIVEKAFAGEATFIEDFPLVIERFGAPEEAWFTFCYSPIRDENGTIVGMIDTVIETTGKVLAERNARTLNAELAHRMKNSLAVVNAVVNQTFRSTDKLDEARVVISQRLVALSEAHSLLTRSSWTSAPIHEVVDGALLPHRGRGSINVDGASIELPARQALSLSLVLNELATNAIKYGALSSSEGEVDLTWQVGAPGTVEPFRLVWQERGGPPVTPPSRRGFGSRLIERVVAQDFLGSARLFFEPAGLRYELTTDMRNLAVGA